MSEQEQRNKKLFEGAFDQLYRPLKYFARNLLSCEEAGESVVIDSFAKLWKRIDNFETIPDIKAFLFITTKNNCIDVLRRRKRSVLALKKFSKLEQQRSDEELESMAERNRIETELVRMIFEEAEALPSDCREIFMLTYYTGLKSGEIAERLSISTSTVTTQRQRAIRYLKTKAGKLWDKLMS